MQSKCDCGELFDVVGQLPRTVRCPGCGEAMRIDGNQQRETTSTASLLREPKPAQGPPQAPVSIVYHRPHRSVVHLDVDGKAVTPVRRPRTFLVDTKIVGNVVGVCLMAAIPILLVAVLVKGWEATHLDPPRPPAARYEYGRPGMEELDRLQFHPATGQRLSESEKVELQKAIEQVKSVSPGSR